MPFKLALVEQHGVEDGFETYRELLGIPAAYRIVKKQLQPLREYARRNAVFFKEIYPAGEPFEIVPPQIVGDNDARPMRGRSRSFYVTCLVDAVVHPHSAVVRCRDALLADYEPGELTAFDDVLALDPLIFHARGEDVWLIERDTVTAQCTFSSVIGESSPYHATGPTRDLAASGAAEFAVAEAFGALLGAHAPHFGHWLWEYLPKYLTAIATGTLPNVPVLMNPAMPPTLWEAMRLLGAPATECIELPFAPVRVARLWYAPALMHEPWLEVANDRYPGPDHRCFPVERFVPTLRAMGRAADAVRPSVETSERVFLARASATARRLANDAEIEAVAVAHGFTVIEPERYSFADQIAIARNASVLAGPEGSQIYLAFFARPQTRLCVLNHRFVQDLLNFCYLVERNGVAVTIFTGPVTRPNDAAGFPNFGLRHYADYAIDAGAFARFLDSWLVPGFPR